MKLKTGDYTKQMCMDWLIPILDDTIGADDPSRPALEAWAKKRLPGMLHDGVEITVQEFQYEICLASEGYELGIKAAKTRKRAG